MDELEMVAVEIKQSNCSPFLVSTWYRPPKSPNEIFEKFEIFLQKTESFYKEFHILGDLNCNLLSNPPETHTTHLIDLLDMLLNIPAH